MYQASKKTDFTVDPIWWGSLRLAPITPGDSHDLAHLTWICGLTQTGFNPGTINVMSLYDEATFVFRKAFVILYELTQPKCVVGHTWLFPFYKGSYSKSDVIHY